MQPIFYRLTQRRGLIFLGLVLLALAILATMIWRNLHHVHTVSSYVNYSHQIQNVSLGLERSVINYLSATDDGSPQPTGLADTLKQIDLLLTNNQYLSNSTRSNLQHIEDLLTYAGSLSGAEKHRQLSAALSTLTETLDHEGLQREKLLAEINLETQAELYISLIIFGLIVLGAILFLQYRILHPLNDLKQLLNKLTDANYTPIATHRLDPLLVPVFDSYNNMVMHLAELEEANRQHAQSLQHEVKMATQTLLEQQQSLAKAEKLAAIGEVAAEFAHEIRNPLAGIQMAFSNLRREINDPQQCDRMQMIDAELKRVRELLNAMLEQSRHTPAAPSTFDIDILLRDLITLVRYQIAENIYINTETTKPLFVHLPECELRQVLLNLILNAAGAIPLTGGVINIKIYLGVNGLHIEVCDSGHGFPQDMLSYGIRPFRTNHAQGTGLGLAMVQRFINNMGGNIKLANNSTQGACVLLYIPQA